MQLKRNIAAGIMPAILCILTLALAAALIGCSADPAPTAPAQPATTASQPAAAPPAATPIPPAAPAQPQPAAPAAMPAMSATSAQPPTTAARPTAAPIRRPTAPAPIPPAPAQPLSIVTTSNIIADWVKTVGGDRTEVFSLVPPGADPHTFRPGAQDVVKIAEADLIFSIGLTLEALWLDELIQNAAADPERVIHLGEIVDPIPFQEIHDEHDEDHDEDADKHDDDEDHTEDADEHDDEHDDEDHDEDADEHDDDEDHDEDADDHADEDHDDEHAHGELDPHFWFDPLRVKRAVNDISARLATLDIDGAQTYLTNANAYNAELDALHEWIEREIEHIPADRRLLVTSHDSMGYFANAYGFDIAGVIIPGGGTEIEPSARDIAELIEHIREVDASTIFPETTISDGLSQRVAEETDAKIAPPLYSGSLGSPGSGADTYIGFMRSNVDIIVEALQ